MKRFEFSLDRLLTIKRQLEKLAELEQQRAAAAVERAREKLRGLREQLARVSERFAAAVGSAMTPQQWGSASDLAERLGDGIRAAEDEAAAAERKLAAAAQERAQVATEVEALATLRRQQWDRWRQEAQRADQDRLDELGLRRWQAARDEGAGPQAPA
ncbi:MAG: flagellar export protein FliJ [Isosphaera sp.]|nr:flagellar export protein FliJ [Isosphaera sp.]